MFQKFNSDTLGGRFIKSLLAQTPLPVFECVTDEDNLIEGCYYIYKRYIIQCKSSGLLKLPKVDKDKQLFPSDNLYPSSFLFPGEASTAYKIARFYVKAYVDFDDIKNFSTFHSRTNYYDSETHYHLGRYLRYIKSTTGLNLFPFYNCYSGKYFSDVELFEKGYVVDIMKSTNQNYKVVAVPILFGKTYSIFIDCPTKVLVRACIHDSNMFSGEDHLKQRTKELFNGTSRIFQKMRFDTPELFRVESTYFEDIMLQKNLYMLIQLPKENDSSIVVLEDYDSDNSVMCDSETDVIQNRVLKPSLIYMNTHDSYAFSDRLIEYLLGNVITEQDLVSNNVSKVQTSLQKHSIDYLAKFREGTYSIGTWDKDIQNIVFKIVKEYSKENSLLDQDGNINKDVESIIFSQGGYY